MGLLAAVMVAGGAGYAAAQMSSGDVAAGKQIAQGWCANCHAVASADQGKANDAVASFTAIARMPSTTSTSLHAFLQTNHGQMPDFKLSLREIDDVVAYILTLQGR
jgi:mono/diheme cytochrome c family protein